MGWLTAIPTTPELAASNDTMSTAVKTFLGIPLVGKDVVCKYCKQKIGDFDKHALKCCDKGALMQRHDSIKKCVNDLCVAGELLVGFKNSHSNHNRRKKDQRCLDLLVHEFSQNGSNLGLDVLVANSFSKLLVAHPKVLAAAETREKEKNGMYLND